MKTFLIKVGCVIGVIISIYVGIIYDINEELSKPDVQVSDIDFEALMTNRVKLESKRVSYPDFDLEHLSVIKQEGENDESRVASTGESAEDFGTVERTEPDYEQDSGVYDSGQYTDGESVSELVESEAGNEYTGGNDTGSYSRESGELDTGDSGFPEEDGSGDRGLIYLGQFTATAYCPCEICCGAYSSGYTASGTYATEGRTVACNSLPFGTQVMIDGNIYTVEDTGWSPYGENWIDIFFYDHGSALAYGMRTVEVYLVG